MSLDSFGARAEFTVGDRTYDMYRLDAVVDDPQTLPYSLRILLENLLRHEDGANVGADDIRALADRSRAATEAGTRELQFMPARVLMQDFTGVPAIVDLAAMRDAMADLGGDPRLIEPGIPVDLVIDHSIVADVAGVADAFVRNAQFEFARNRERYTFLRWAQSAFRTLRVFPPNRGICHQVNLEYLAQVVFRGPDRLVYPDTLVGTDSHTPMVNGLGVLGWGVGGIEAEAAMLGQPLSMLLPRVVGIELVGALPVGSTATDLVLTVAELLRRHGVVGKFVEFYGEGVGRVPLENRATIGNMSPEYGSTCTIFPVDDETLRYLRATGRPDDLVALVESYAKEQGLWHDPAVRPVYDETISFDLSTVEPSLAGPARPQDRVTLPGARGELRAGTARVPPRGGHCSEASDRRDPLEGRRAVDRVVPRKRPARAGGRRAARRGARGRRCPPDPARPQALSGDARRRSQLRARRRARGDRRDHVVHQHVEPVGDDRRGTAREERGRARPACAAVGEDLARSGLARRHRVLRARAADGTAAPARLRRGRLRVHHLHRKLRSARARDLRGRRSRRSLGGVGALGQSQLRRPHLARLPDELSRLATARRGLRARRHDGRRPVERPGRYRSRPARPCICTSLWPSEAEVAEVVGRVFDRAMFEESYATILDGDENWRALPAPTGDRYEWDPDSTYIRRPTFLEGIAAHASAPRDIAGARVLALLGDSVTTDHISPAGAIRRDGPAGTWLQEHGVRSNDFNSYGSRRGNHEVMVRGTFANIRLRNRLAPGTEGGVTLHLPGGEPTTIYDAAMTYAAEGVPLVVLAGKEYGSGSSRDWAAKGSQLLGIRAVLVESFERIHRSNLVGMGLLPLEFVDGASTASLGLTGHEVFAIAGLEALAEPGPLPRDVSVTADDKQFRMRARIDTPFELAVFLEGGILAYTLRRLVRSTAS